MLRFFSKFQRSSKVILVIFCAVLFLGLIMFYAFPNQQLPTNGAAGVNPDDGKVIAKVGSQEITLKEYREQLMNMVQAYSRGGQADPRIIKAMKLDQQTLDRLIEDRVVLGEAERLGFNGTDQEINESITKAFVDPDTGKFVGKEDYLRSLRLQGKNPEEFERGIRTSLMTSKMRSFLSSGAQVSDKEIQEAYKADNTKVEVIYATVDKDKIKDKPKMTEPELQAYFEAHKADYKATDPLRKVEYIFIPTDKVMVTVTDEQLKAEYEKNKQKEPRVSIIKLNVATPTDEPTVRAKINELNARVRGGENKQPEDFAAVAKGNSQDPSAAKGGDIGFVKKNPNNANDWKQRAIDQAANAIVGPFRDGSSWYIMKITEERDVPFEEMKPTLIAGTKNRSSYQKANEIADKAYELFTANKDLRKTAETIAAEMKVKPEDLIRTTPYFKKGDTLPEIGSNPTFEDNVAELKKGDIGVKLGVPNGMAIPRVVDVLEGGVQLTFEQAHNQIESKLGRERELNAAQEKARDILTKAKTADEFKSLLAKDGIEVKTDANNLASMPFSSLQVSQQIRSAVMATKQGEAAKAPIKTGAGSYLVFAATKRTEADLTKLTAEEKSSLRQRLVSEKGSLAYDTFVKDIRKKYDAEKKITIYQDRIDAYVSSLNANQANQ